MALSVRREKLKIEWVDGLDGRQKDESKFLGEWDDGNVLSLLLDRKIMKI